MIRPPFEIFPELLSQRILLRELIASDLPENLDITFFNRIPATTLEEGREKQALVQERYLAGDDIHWGIQDRSSGKIVGCCGFYRGFANDAGEIGYAMKEYFRNSGYMSEAVRLLVEFGFGTMQLKKIFAITAQTNLASQSVLRKNGFIAGGIEENGDLRFHILP